MALNREAILNAAKTAKTVPVDVPELGGTVLVRGLSSKEWDAHQASIRVYSGDEQVGIDEGNITARLLVRCVVDDTGKRILKDTDAAAFGDLPITVMNKISEAVFKVSGLSEDGAAEVKADLKETASESA